MSTGTTGEAGGLCLWLSTGTLEKGEDVYEVGMSPPQPAGPPFPPAVLLSDLV